VVVTVVVVLVVVVVVGCVFDTSTRRKHVGRICKKCKLVLKIQKQKKIYRDSRRRRVSSQMVVVVPEVDVVAVRV
jgi:hypothetical protein